MYIWTYSWISINMWLHFDKALTIDTPIVLSSIKPCHCRWPWVTFKGHINYWKSLQCQYLEKCGYSHKLEFHGTDTDTDTDFRDAPIVQYTRTCVHARIPNRQPRQDPREKRACRTSRRGSSCVSGSWQAERGRRLPREYPRAEVGEDVRVGVGLMEFQLYEVNYDARKARVIH